MKLILTYVAVFYSTLLMADEKKDTIMLSEVVKVEVASTKIQDYESPFADLKYKVAGRLGDALGEYSSVYIKKYGRGQLASLAVRGTSATQSEIQWNGIKLNMPSLGQVDLSLFTIGMQDELQLVRTGSQGTIGGTLKMNNEIKLDSGFTVNTIFRLGSFNTYEAMADVQYARSGFFGATKFTYSTSQNDFKYRNSYEFGNPYRKQQNAAIQQLSFLQQLSGRLNENQELNFYLWLNSAQRQIPPVMSKADSKESQDDYSMRAMGNWKGKFKLLKLGFSSAYLFDRIIYRNPDALIDAPSSTYAFRNTFTASYFFPFHLAINGELHYDHEQANVSEYGRPKMRNIISVRTYTDYYLRNNFRFHAGFREDLVDKRLSAFAPEFSFNYLGRFAVQHKYTLGIIASRNFRFPTLNDLYWNPGGNPNLQQEKAWNGELQFKYGYKRIVDVSLSNFYIYVNNWIQWVPQGTIWMPVNFKRVFSRGFEAALHVSNATENDLPKKFVVHVNTSYTYTKATNLDAASEFDLSKGAQLIYVPLHNVVGGLQLQYYRFYLRSINTYTGSVYISTDNSRYLAGYFVSDLELGKYFLLKGIELGFSIRMNNIANTQYQAVAQKPMPGRNFEGTLRFKFF